jgi:hypothetical protein
MGVAGGAYSIHSVASPRQALVQSSTREAAVPDDLLATRQVTPSLRATSTARYVLRNEQYDDGIEVVRVVIGTNAVRWIRLR